jgi:hypothetical protein
MLNIAVQYLGKDHLDVIQHILSALYRRELQDGGGILHLTEAQKVILVVTLEFIKAYLHERLQLRTNVRFVKQDHYDV